MSFREFVGAICEGDQQFPARPGVYVIKNLWTDRLYVGISKNIRRRVAVHRAQLKCGTHRNALLRDDWREYGPALMVFATYKVIEDFRERFVVEADCISACSGNTYNKYAGLWDAQGATEAVEALCLQL